MFCIVEKGRPRAGIIYKPFKNQTLASFYEKKTPKKINRLQSRNRVVVSRSHAGSVIEYVGENIKDAQIIPAGGSGYKTMSLISNQADLYLHTTKIKKWDVCAPDAILSNFNGRLTTLAGEEINYSSEQSESKVVNGLVAALHDHQFFLQTFQKYKI